jgi:hypothetical protein
MKSQHFGEEYTKNLDVILERIEQNDIRNKEETKDVVEKDEGGQSEGLSEAEQLDEIIGGAVLGAIGTKLWQNREKLGPIIDKIKTKGKRLDALGDFKDILITPDIDAAAIAFQKYLKSMGVNAKEDTIKNFLIKRAIIIADKKMDNLATKGREPKASDFKVVD